MRGENRDEEVVKEKVPTQLLKLPHNLFICFFARVLISGVDIYI